MEVNRRVWKEAKKEVPGGRYVRKEAEKEDVEAIIVHL